MKASTKVAETTQQRTPAARALRSPWLWLAACLIGIGLLTAIGPAERSLGTNVRVVYLHGAWVWAALAAFAGAAAVGLAGLLRRRADWQGWSRALGRAGLLFWITYLPISLWAMETNWNGLFLAEPRWRLALVFAVGGLLLQAGVAIMGEPAWAAAANVLFLLALGLALATTENVMHPPAPILNSDARRIQIYFLGLLLLTVLAAGQVARLFQRLEPD